MELCNILSFLENKAILVTGGAGFLGKIFAEKVLRIQPNVKKLYLLVRAPDNNSASLRLQNEVIGKELFKVIKEKMGGNFNDFISEKVRVVAGDIACMDLGIIDPNLKDEIFRDTHLIINLAATTNFIDRYDIALNVNTFGAKHVLDFAKKCPNLKLVVQVSTAYISGERGGIIKEEGCEMGHSLNGRNGLDIQLEKQAVEAKLQQLLNDGATQETIKLTMKDMGMERARHWGWPNVYVFTKALGEMIVMQEKEEIPLVILRPTIVLSTYKEPFPGWIEGLRTMDSIVVAYGKGRLPFFIYDTDSVIDMIPADMVVNAILVAMEANANQKGDPTIYHVGSSVKNPVKISVIQDVAYKYFTKHPWINKDGNPVIVRHVNVFDSMDSLKKYLQLYYLLPLKGLEIANTLLCQYFGETYMKMRGKMNHIMRLIDIYEPYLFFKGTYDDLNTERLRIAAKEPEDDHHDHVLNFDPNAIDWEEYLNNIHLPGVVKYLLN